MAPVTAIWQVNRLCCVDRQALLCHYILTWSRTAAVSKYVILHILTPSQKTKEDMPVIIRQLLREILYVPLYTIDGSDRTHVNYRISDPQSTSHQLINIVTNSMASPAEPSFKTIGVSLAFSGKSVPSNVLTSSTPNIRCSAPLYSFSASEVRDISMAYEAGNGGRSPDDVATVHLAILLDSILNEAQGAYTTEESQRVNLVLEKYKGLVRTFVQRKTNLMEAAMKFASDVSPLCTELTSALDNPIWGWRLRRKHWLF
jgi:hypothetical protein